MLVEEAKNHRVHNLRVGYFGVWNLPRRRRSEGERGCVGGRGVIEGVSWSGFRSTIGFVSRTGLQVSVSLVGSIFGRGMERRL